MFLNVISFAIILSIFNFMFISILGNITLTGKILFLSKGLFIKAKIFEILSTSNFSLFKLPLMFNLFFSDLIFPRPKISFLLSNNLLTE